MFLFLLFSLLQNPAARADEASCLQIGMSCSDVDIDRPLAKASYEKGCLSNDAYACARLGQYYEVKENDPVKAAQWYDKACKGRDSFGCEQGEAMHQRLCFGEGKKKFCDGRAPHGDYRVFVYLKTFNPKYADAFQTHDFDRPWEVKEAGALFDKLVKEHSPRLLKALLQEKKAHNRHDGADAEALDDAIACLKGKCRDHSLDEGYKGIGQTGKHPGA